jgi:hypothetical protein
MFRTLVSILGVLAIASAGCSTTRQTRTVEPSGFLGDYSQLQPGEDDQAQLVYIAPDLDLSGYHAIMIDSVTLWQSSDASPLPREESQALTDYLYQALHEQLALDWRIADRPGPTVLRLRAAITEAKGARVVGNAVTTVIPQLKLLSTVAGVSSDTQVFVGKAAMEVELTDSMSGRRLAAAVDARAGGKTLRGGLAKWSDVKNAFDYWAQRLRTRLAEESARTR